MRIHNRERYLNNIQSKKRNAFESGRNLITCFGDVLN